MDPGGCDILRFNVSNGCRYRFTFCEGDNAPGATFNTGLRAYDANCNIIGQNGATCGNQAQLDVTANYTGYLYLQVQGQGGTGGDFRLAFIQLCKPCPLFDFGPFVPTPTVATHSSTMPGNWGAANVGCRMYAFDLTAKRTYRFSSCAVDGGNATFAERIRIFTGACAVCTVSSVSCFPGTGFDFTPKTTGRYYVQVSPLATAGVYTLTYRELCRDCAAGPDVAGLAPDCAYQQVALPWNGGSCRVLEFDVIPGQPYRFTTCGLDQDFVLTGGSSTHPDTIITALNGACADSPPGAAMAPPQCDDDGTSLCFLGGELDVVPTATPLRIRLSNFWCSPQAGNVVLAYRLLGDPLDPDLDRLGNCIEDAIGTDRLNPDTDGDGIWDGDEYLGTLAGLDLPTMGANPATPGHLHRVRLV